MPTASTATTTQTRPARAVPWALAAGLVLVAVAMALPAITGWNVRVRWFPPLHADWDPRLGWGTPLALLVGGLGAAYAVRLAASLPWGRLLLVVYAGGLAWLLSLAFVDGTEGIGHILTTGYEYLDTARATTDFPATLREYVSRIPYSAAPDNWPVHIAGHPPGALGFFVVLVHLGLGTGFGAGFVVTLFAASTAVAVMVTMRVLGAESWARRAAPFLVLGPAAIWQAVSADAMFAAVAAWGMAALAVAATSRGRRWLPWSLLAGLLLGYCVMLSYGLPLLGILALTVLWLGRSWRPLVPAALAALAVVLAFAAYGFSWWDAVRVLHGRYFEGVAGRRPPAYWMWGNLAALTFAAGPMVWAGVAEAAARWRRWLAEARVPMALTAAGVAMVATADLSQMSRAEVERIWLPFVPWMLVGCALLPEPWRQRGLWLQIGVALVVQHLLFTGW
jgi:methylthioxylose transferase